MQVNFNSKKELKQAILDGKDFLIIDPSIFTSSPQFMWSELKQKELFDIAVTKHPERKWFARIYKHNGKIKVE